MMLNIETEIELEELVRQILGMVSVEMLIDTIAEEGAMVENNRLEVLETIEAHVSQRIKEPTEEEEEEQT